MGGDVAAWDPIRMYFDERGYTTIGIDLRAHGYSGRPDSRSGYELEAFARDVQAVLASETSENIVMIGHCFGAMVAYTYEFLFPGEVEALVLINTGYESPYFSDKSLVKKFIKAILPRLARISPGKYTPKHVDYTVKKYERDFEPIGLIKVLKNNSLKTFFSLTDVIFSLNVVEKLGKITAPTLIIAGTNDTIYPLKLSETMHTRIKSSELKIISGANHPVVLNMPEEVAHNIKIFLEQEHSS